MCSRYTSRGSIPRKNADLPVGMYATRRYSSSTSTGFVQDGSLMSYAYTPELYPHWSPRPRAHSGAGLPESPSTSLSRGNSSSRRGGSTSQHSRRTSITRATSASFSYPCDACNETFKTPKKLRYLDSRTRGK